MVLIKSKAAGNLRLTEMTFRIESPEVELGLLGAQDKFVVLLEEGMNVTINPFGTDLVTSGGEDEDVHLTHDVLEQLVICCIPASA